MPATSQANDVPAPRVTPMAAAPITGTPAEILQEIPVTEPLTVGYKAGLFLPVGAMKEKDKRGCTLRNQLLIKLATKKPKVGKKCKLTGGEWKVDFGTKTIKKPGQVKLGTLLPDKYVYAQGAYGWTDKQREIYAENYAPAKSLTGSSRAAVNSLFTNSTQQTFSGAGIKKVAAIHSILNNTAVEQRGGDQRDAQVAAELDALRAQNPEFFDSWTVATLLNAKSWGLSFTPGTNANFQVTIEECSREEAPKGEQNPCSTTYSVPNEAAKYNITAVPQTASLVPPTLSGGSAGQSVPDLSYQAPTGDPIDRFMFGIHAPANWVSDIATGFEGPIEEATIPNVPVGYVRLWDTETTWADIEPQKGEFVWRKLDKQIQMAQILDARVMLVLGQTPSWAGDSPQSMPRNIQDWRDYVREVACRYGPSIASFEVWNEANLSTFWTGTPEQMADLTNAAFEEIRGCENSGALVVAANTTSRATGSFGTFYPEYLQGLKARNWPVDAYSVHSYPTASGGANDRIRGIGQFRTMLAAAGAPQTTVFDTEINYGLAGLGEGKVDLTGENAMALMSRTYIDSVRYGFGSTFWFVWTANPDSKFGIQFTRAAAAEQSAWNNTYDWLIGAQFQRCVETDDQVVICQFNRGPDNFSIVWRGEVGSAPGEVSPSLVGQLGSRKCDLYSNCELFTATQNVAVGPMPIRIDGAPLDISAIPGSDPQADPDNLIDFAAELQAPIIEDVTVVYESQNRVIAAATWSPPINAANWKIRNYEYEWKYCDDKCTTIAKGTTSSSERRVTTPLTKGPGRYEFVLRVNATGFYRTPNVIWNPLVGGGIQTFVPEILPRPMTTSARESFRVYNTRVVPPTEAYLTLAIDKGIVEWTEPEMRKARIEGYEVQVRNVTTDGPWQDVPTEKSQMRAEFSTTDYGMAFGDEVVARVRTVMTTGVTSRFTVTPVMILQPQSSPVTSYYAHVNNIGALAINNSPPANMGGLGAPGCRYPDNVVQVRYSNDGGATWKLADYNVRLTEYVLQGSMPPPSSASSFPNCVTALGNPKPGDDFINGTTIFEMRHIDVANNLVPSDWKRIDPSWSYRGTELDD